MKRKVLAVATAVLMMSSSLTAFAANSPSAKDVASTVQASSTQTANVVTDIKTETPSAYVEKVSGAKATVGGQEVAAPTIAAVSEATVTSLANVVKEQLKDVASMAKNLIGGEKGTAIANAATNANAKITTEIKSVVDVTAPAGVTVSASNPITLTFNVSGVSTGSYIMILHYNSAKGAWESIPATCGNGTVTGTFTSLSPIAFVELKTEESLLGVRSPKTADAYPVMLACTAAFAGGAIVFGKKARKVK